MFNSGLTEESIQCSVCKNVTKQQIPFEELILYFDKSHHDDNKKHNSCTLGELFTSYFTTNDDNLERECHTCNERTRSTVQNCICHYPEVLCIVLCRNIFKDNTSSRIHRWLIFQLKTSSGMNILESMRELMIRHTTLWLQ